MVRGGGWGEQQADDNKKGIGVKGTTSGRQQEGDWGGGNTSERQPNLTGGGIMCKIRNRKSPPRSLL